MCLQCTAECVTLGEIVPGFWLVKSTKDTSHGKAGWFGVVQSNDPAVIWYGEPLPDPLEGMTDEAVDALSDEDMEPFFEWVASVDKFSDACKEQLDLSTAYLLGKRCVEAGWDLDIDGSLEHWLFTRMFAISAGSVGTAGITTHGNVEAAL